MSATVVPYLSVKGKVEEELKEIFFESSTKKEFKDEAEKEAFYFKYLGFYLSHYPELAWVALQKEKVLGYVVVAPETNTSELQKIQPHLSVFHKDSEKFPAHLHINCHFESRGMGVGKALVETVIDALKTKNIKGLHIMTGPASKNRSFYKKLGFEYETESNFHGSPILFMGKSL